jgi:hypothetical protein
MFCIPNEKLAGDYTGGQKCWGDQDEQQFAVRQK